MDRRDVLLVLAALGCERAVAQGSAPLPRVAFVSNRDGASASPFMKRFVDGMQESGYVDKRNYILDVRYANNDQARIGPAIKEAVATRPAVLVVTGLYAAQQARDATKTVPVVVATGSDLVEAGIVQNYRKPGGNITGVADLTDVTSVKRLELLREALPNAGRVGLIVNPDFPATPRIEKVVAAAAQRLSFVIVTARANDRPSLIAAIERLARERVDALLVGGDNNTTSNASFAIERATELRIPIAYFWPGTAEMGALFSYQADVLGNFERASSHVVRILKGAKPGDLPIELPSRYELVVNRKAAAALGISLPNALILRADHVID